MNHKRATMYGVWDKHYEPPCWDSIGFFWHKEHAIEQALSRNGVHMSKRFVVRPCLVPLPMHPKKMKVKK